MWKQTKIARWADYSAFQEALAQIMVSSGGPKDFALLIRHTEDPGVEILALSPQAAKFGYLLQDSVWVDLLNPQDFGWTTLIADGSLYERHGLRYPRSGDPGM